MRTIDERRRDLQGQLESTRFKTTIIAETYENQVGVLQEEQDRRVKAVTQKLRILELAHLQRLKKQELIVASIERGIEELRGHGSENPDSLEAYEAKIQSDIEFRKYCDETIAKGRRDGIIK